MPRILPLRGGIVKRSYKLLDFSIARNYNLHMVTYDEPKRQINLSRHGIDLAEVETVFDAPMLTEEDDRAAYGEQRLKSTCFLQGRVVVLIWTERETCPHFISCRYGDKRETDEYFKEFL